MASARSIPPSIASRRARKTCSKRGATNLNSTNSTTANAIRPMMISPRGGRSGLCSSSAAQMSMVFTILVGEGTRTRRYGSDAEDEGDDEADQGERLGEGEAEEGVGTGQTGRLGLTGGGLDVGGPHDADADAGADGGEAVADRADAAGHFCQKIHCGVFLLCRRPVSFRAAGSYRWCGSGGADRWCRCAQCSASMDPFR